MSSLYFKGSQLIIKHAHEVFPKANTMLIGKQHQNNSLFFNEDETNLQSFFFKNTCPIHVETILALYPNVRRNDFLKLIVSFHSIGQHINLFCSMNKDLLTHSMLENLFVCYRDAVDPKRKRSCYLEYCDDNALINLNDLVEECRSEISKLPSYNLVIGLIKKHVQLFSDLHMLSFSDIDNVEKKNEAWALKYISNFPGINPWEFCSAVKSPLLISVLFACAYDSNLTLKDVEGIYSTYFPWICILHTMLNHFVNEYSECIQGFNTSNYYKNLKEYEERLSFLMQYILKKCNTLEYPEFHKTLVKSILSMYLSDPNASMGMNKLATMSLLRKKEYGISLYHNIYKLIRFAGML